MSFIKKEKSSCADYENAQLQLVLIANTKALNVEKGNFNKALKHYFLNLS